MSPVVLNTSTVTRVSKTPIVLIAILATATAPMLLGGIQQVLPSVHAVTGQNLVGINCALGTIDPTTGVTLSERDGDGTIQSVCQWAGDTDADGPTVSAGAEPLVTDPSPFNPAQPCSVAPCGAPGGGGFEADIIITNLNDSINGFDLSVSYDTKILNAVLIDQAGLEFGGNVACSSCTITLAATIDNTQGSVRLAQVLLSTVTGTVGGSVTLFRIRFDVVGAGRSALTIGGLDKITHSFNFASVPLGHTDIQGSFSTNAFYDLIVNGCPSSPNCSTSGLGFNASWTYSPIPAVAGSSVTFTAMAACENCTGSLHYFWAWSTAEGLAPTIQQTGATVTLTTPLPKITRVALIVTDSATPVANNVTATRFLPLAATVYGPSAINSGTSGDWTGWWIGGVAPYNTVLWKLCPSPGTSSFTICTTPTINFASSPTQLQNSTISETYNFAGLYLPFLQIIDSSPAWTSRSSPGITSTTIVSTVIDSFPLNVTGSNPAFTVSLSSNATATDVGHGIQLSASVAYNANYPTTARAAIFNYTFYFGDGSAASSLGGASGQTIAHAYATPGTFTVRVTVQEASGVAATKITETAYSSEAIASAPTVSFSLGPSAPTAGQTVSFTPAVVAGTSPYSYSWNFGDGTSSTESSPSHTYASEGSYNVTLTVTDSSGSMTAYSHIVDVTAAQQPSLPYLYIGLGAGIAVIVAASAAVLFRRRGRPSKPPNL